MSCTLGVDIESILGVSKARVALIVWRAPACHEEQGSSMIQRDNLLWTIVCERQGGWPRNWQWQLYRLGKIPVSSEDRNESLRCALINMPLHITYKGIYFLLSGCFLEGGMELFSIRGECSTAQWCNQLALRPHYISLSSLIRRPCLLEVSERTSLQMYTKPKPAKLSRKPRAGRTSVTLHFTK